MKGTLVRRQVSLIPSTIDFAFGSQQLAKVVASLEEMRTEHAKEHQERMAKLDAALAHALQIQKGEKGDKPVAGRDYPVPRNGKDADESAVIDAVMKNIRQPKDGESPVVDYETIQRKVVSLIPKPEPGKPGKDGKSVSIEEIIDALKKNLKVEHIPGLKNEIASYRNQLAGKIYGKDTWARGGGDSVVAGSGVTITSVNGQKVISSVGSGGLGYLPVVSGAINNSNTVFTFAQTPTIVVVNGASYINGSGVTISGTTATLDNAAGTGGSVYALG